MHYCFKRQYIYSILTSDRITQCNTDQQENPKCTGVVWRSVMKCVPGWPEANKLAVGLRGVDTFVTTV